MKAYLRSARIAPKKANIVAKMVRGMSVSEAMLLLSRTHKKSARLIEKLLKSAVANARHNDKQHPTDLVIKTIIVNQSMGYPRGVPMARGRIRAMTKFLSHIDIALGIADTTEEKTQKKQKTQTTQKSGTSKIASQTVTSQVKKSPSSEDTSKASSGSSESSESSGSSDSSASS